MVSPTVIKCDVASVIDANEWNDELHPSRKGFQDAAGVFLLALKQHLPALFP
jgi:hypothetical protein